MTQLSVVPANSDSDFVGLSSASLTFRFTTINALPQNGIVEVFFPMWNP